MNAPVLAFVSSSASDSGYRELDFVRLLREAVTDEGAVVPAGSTGTVMSVWANGGSLAVESAKFDGLLFVSAEDVERVR